MKKDIFPKYSGFSNTGKHDYDNGFDVGRRPCHKRIMRMVKRYRRRKDEEEIDDQLSDMEEEHAEREAWMERENQKAIEDFEFMYRAQNQRYMEEDLGVCFELDEDGVLEPEDLQHRWNFSMDDDEDERIISRMKELNDY